MDSEKDATGAEKEKFKQFSAPSEEEAEEIAAAEDAIITKHFDKINAAEELAVGAHDPNMNGAIEVEISPSEGVPVAGSKVGKMRRPVLAVGIWAKVARAKFREPLVLSNGLQLSSASAPQYSMYLLTNRMIKVKDPKSGAHVYAPCENVIYFTVEGDDATRKRLESQ